MGESPCQHPIRAYCIYAHAGIGPAPLEPVPCHGEVVQGVARSGVYFYRVCANSKRSLRFEGLFRPYMLYSLFSFLCYPVALSAPLAPAALASSTANPPTNDAYGEEDGLPVNTKNMQPPTPSNMRAPLRGAFPQKRPATWHCSLCPKRYTRAFNLRSHIRTHTAERPFLCSVCGRPFARVHDRNTHEHLHSGERKFLCGGQLKNGQHWGCGRRFARSSNLGRHFRSSTGRRCIRPLLDEETAERNAATRLTDYNLDLIQPPPQQASAEHSAATTLTDTARTLDTGAFSGVPSARPNVPQAVPPAAIYSSANVDWDAWDS